MTKSDREFIAGLQQNLATMKTELAALEAAGKSGDLKAIFLREGIESTTYRIEVETEEANAPKRDMRFLARNAPKK